MASTADADKALDGGGIEEDDGDAGAAGGTKQHAAPAPGDPLTGVVLAFAALKASSVGDDPYVLNAMGELARVIGGFADGATSSKKAAARAPGGGKEAAARARGRWERLRLTRSQSGMIAKPGLGRAKMVGRLVAVMRRLGSKVRST